MALSVRKIAADMHGNQFMVSGRSAAGYKVSITTKTMADAYAIREAYRTLSDPEELRAVVDRILRSGSCRGGQIPEGLRFMYHVTFANRLGVIRDRGLLPIVSARPTAMASCGYVDEGEGKVFFTGPEGIAYWFEISERIGRERSQDVLSDGHVPVVLRVLLDPCQLETDKLGVAQSGASAWIGYFPIKASDMQLWTGSKWVHPYGWGAVDLSQGRLLPSRASLGLAVD